jgi:hypothetical protein
VGTQNDLCSSGASSLAFDKRPAVKLPVDIMTSVPLSI